jgi:hypothetical protein
MVVTGTDVYQNPMVYHNLFIEETILGVSGYPSYQNLPELSEGEVWEKPIFESFYSAQLSFESILQVLPSFNFWTNMDCEKVAFSATILKNIQC